jgi:FkbM family methyltransferase
MNIKSRIIKTLRSNKSGYSFIPYNSYSLEGEDMILRKLFNKYDNGFYIDVGANQPFRYSNTAYFYKLGWRGINIDASRKSIKLLNKHRKRDRNIFALISNVESKITYYLYKDDALNTTSRLLTDYYATKLKIIPEKKIRLRATKLKIILKKYLSSNQQINFLNVDVEGQELDVLQSNDWVNVRPNFLVIEDLNLVTLQDTLNSRVNKYLLDKNYIAISKTVTNIIYLDKLWKK